MLGERGVAEEQLGNARLKLLHPTSLPSYESLLRLDDLVELFEKLNGAVRSVHTLLHVFRLRFGAPRAPVVLTGTWTRREAVRAPCARGRVGGETGRRKRCEEEGGAEIEGRRNG